MKTQITQQAQKEKNRLWPDNQSKIKDTDPELAQIFDNFAFDEIVSHDTMDSKTRVLMIIASNMGNQALTIFKKMVNAALNIGVKPLEVREIVYQGMPYLGIGKVIDFLYAMNDIFKERNIDLPLDGQSTTTIKDRLEKGLAKQKEIFGDENIDSMYNSSPKDLLHIQHYLSDNCFGDYVTREGLDTQTREMATLSFLISMGGTESQIKGHIRGNLNVGNDRQKLIDLMTQLLPYVGYPRTLNAINCLNEIIPPTK